MDEYNSRIRYTLQVLLKQPGINENHTIKELLQIFKDDDTARLVDQRIDAPTYAGKHFIRFTDLGLMLLTTLTPKAVKIIIVLAGQANQSLRVQISQSDLAELAQMSKPTVASAVEELQKVSAIFIKEGDATNGEADTYYLNPAICSCSKMSMQDAQEAIFWNLLKPEHEPKERTEDPRYKARVSFRERIDQTKKDFEESFEVTEQRDTTTREPLGVTIEKRGKIKTQEQAGRRRRKKRVNAGNIDPSLQDTTSPTSHNYNKPSTTEKTRPFKNNMQKPGKKLTRFEDDPEIPFN